MAYPTPNKDAKTLRPELSSGGSKVDTPRNGGWAKGLITLIAILVIIAGGLYLIKDKSLGSAAKLTGDWQAVFLSNGQVYFGKVQSVTSDTVYLKNIYYLQVVQQPLQRSQEGEEVPTVSGSEQRLTLIKLGNELHGPVDEMVINRFHVILMEDLKDDSRVVQAINDYVASQTE